MPPTKAPRFSFLFGGGGDPVRNSGSRAPPPPSLKLKADRDVYRPGDPVVVTIAVTNSNSPNNSSTSTSTDNVGEDASSFLIERLSFEMKGIEKLDTQWFTTPKPLNDTKHRKGEYVFVDCPAASVVSNQTISPGATKSFLVRTFLPSIIPPSYRGATVRYIYFVRCTLFGQYLILENGHTGRRSKRDLVELEARIALQIWVTQKTNGLPVEEGGSNAIVPASTVFLEFYWKEVDGDSDWARANETYDGVEEGYESSRDEISSVSSYNPSKESLHRAFGSSLSLQSSIGRSSNHDSPYLRERTSISSYMPLPRLSVAEVLYDSGGNVLSPGRSSDMIPSSQQLKLSKSIPVAEDTGLLVQGAVEPVS